MPEPEKKRLMDLLNTGLGERQSIECSFNLEIIKGHCALLIDLPMLLVAMTDQAIFQSKVHGAYEDAVDSYNAKHKDSEIRSELDRVINIVFQMAGAILDCVEMFRRP